MAALRSTKDAALRLLKSAARTRRELIDRLVRAGHDPAAAESTVADLARAGMIDEAAIAGAAVRAGLKAGKARGHIEQALRARGVDDPTIHAALSDEQVTDDTPRALDAARDLARRAAGADPAARMRRVLTGLARRGFDEDTALNAARQALGTPTLPDDPDPRPADD